MTYLSRVRMNPLREASRKLLANPRAIHAAVLGGLPDPTADERLLWRLDNDNAHRPHLFVLTRSRPDWSHLVEQIGWPDADGEHAAVRDYAPLLAQVAMGREFAFRLTANPVQNTQTPDKPTTAQAKLLAERAKGGEKRGRGFRLAHRTAAAQLNWFLSRTERWGFEVPGVRTDPAAPGMGDLTRSEGAPEEVQPRWDPNPPYEVRITARNRHSVQKNPKGALVVFHSATFEGRLLVTDTELFKASLLGGIGPSKAYGCGLLTLAPLPKG